MQWSNHGRRKRGRGFERQQGPRFCVGQNPKKAMFHLAVASARPQSFVLVPVFGRRHRGELAGEPRGDHGGSCGNGLLPPTHGLGVPSKHWLPGLEVYRCCDERRPGLGRGGGGGGAGSAIAVSVSAATATCAITACFRVHVCGVFSVWIWLVRCLGQFVALQHQLQPEPVGAFALVQGEEEGCVWFNCSERLMIRKENTPPRRWPETETGRDWVMQERGEQPPEPVMVEGSRRDAVRQRRRTRPGRVPCVRCARRAPPARSQAAA